MAAVQGCPRNPGLVGRGLVHQVVKPGCFAQDPAAGPCLTEPFCGTSAVSELSRTPACPGHAWRVDTARAGARAARGIMRKQCRDQARLVRGAPGMRVQAWQASWLLCTHTAGEALVCRYPGTTGGQARPAEAGGGWAPFGSGLGTHKAERPHWRAPGAQAPPRTVTHVTVSFWKEGAPPACRRADSRAPRSRYTHL